MRAVKQLLGAVFGVLGGSEGKVGLAPAKASLLQAAGGLAASAVSDARAVVLAASATGHFVTFLEAETHEGSLVTVLCWGCWPPWWTAGPRPDRSARPWRPSADLSPPR
jgi:hypothetical protein